MFINKKGQAVVQALAGAALAAALAVGTIAVVNDRKRSIVNAQVTNRTAEIQRVIQEMVRDDRAWSKMVNLNTSMACLRLGGNCNGVSDQPFILYDANGAAFYDAVTLTDSGFDTAGKPCRGYVAPNASGNDACPFRVILTWTAIQPNSPAGPPPTVCTQAQCEAGIKGVFTYNPNYHSTDGVNRSGPLNVSKYEVNFVRERRVASEYLVVRDEKPLNTPGGSCTPVNTWIKRDLNTVVTDNGNNVMSITANKNVNLKAGNYTCEVSAPAEGSGVNHQARMVITGGGVTPDPTVIVGTSGNYVGPSMIRGTFLTTSNGAVLNVEHVCNQDAGNTTLGSPVNLGNREVYTVVNCQKNGN